MKTIPVAVASFWCLLACGLAAHSQPTQAEQEVQAAVAMARQPYERALAPHPQLLNGPEYLDYSKPYASRLGHQFFQWPEAHPGSVFYNGHSFQQVQLAYDAVRDQVVLMPANSPLLLRLISDNVREFTIQDHHFVRLVADSASANVIRTGFYEVLLDSTVQVLAKRSKKLQERIAQQSINVEFIETDRLFLRKDGRYYAISSKATAVRPFADRAKEIQQYLQAHKLKFKRSRREASLVQLAAYYSSLPPR